MLFDQLATMAQAAAAGLGVALLPTFLFEEEVDSGKLVHALSVGMQSKGRYFMVWPPDRAMYPPLVAFRDWLLTDTAADR
jgi:LysR family glycine cleavage system transcriptional activator